MRSAKFIAIIYALFVSFAPQAFALLTCEEIGIEEHPLVVHRFGKERVEEEIQTQKTYTKSLTQAKGVVGESLTRELFEHMGWVSIATLFAQQGCDVDDILRGGSNHGIDDIFVKLTPHGWIDERKMPVFNESKFRKNGRISVADLDVTTHCKQTTFTWLGHHVHLSKNRVGARVCTPTHEVDIYASCSSCKAKTLASLKWLRKQLESQNVVRTVSIIGDAGTMSLFKVVTQ